MAGQNFSESASIRARRRGAPDTMYAMDPPACDECGHAIPPGDKVCPRCGAKPSSNRATILFAAGAAVFIVAAILASILSDHSHSAGELTSQSGDVGPGSSYANEHPDLLPTVTAMITSRGHKCPMLVNLWNESDHRYGTRLEAICGPDRDHIDASLHYAIYLQQQSVSVCQPWKEFGPDCE
jgi:predicted nucleic acid-binding Zn ribbon protein